MNGRNAGVAAYSLRRAFVVTVSVKPVPSCRLQEVSIRQERCEPARTLCVLEVNDLRRDDGTSEGNEDVEIPRERVVTTLKLD